MAIHCMAYVWLVLSTSLSFAALNCDGTGTSRRLAIIVPISVTFCFKGCTPGYRSTYMSQPVPK